MSFESLLVFILFKFKKRPNISGIRVVCVTVHTAGRNEEHADVDKLKLTVFNKDKARQDKAGQTHRNTGE